MCIYHYHGFCCGHRDPDAPFISPTLCQQPVRLPHEPMCNPPIYNIRLIDSNFCETCQTMIDSLSGEWAAIKRIWRFDTLPSAVISSLDGDRTQLLNRCLTEGLSEGPSHTKNVQFPRADWAATQEGKRLSKQVEDGRRDWEIQITYLRGYGLAESFIQEAEQKRREVEAEYPNDVSKVWQIKRELVNALARESTREYADSINLNDYLEEFYLD